ncbi:MAG: hypothetical protein AAGA93_06115 [Actinomycetota bacterium]
MRPVLKAFASDHPVIVFFAVAARWAAWTIVGCPVVVVALVVLVAAGAPWRITLVVTVTGFAAMTGWGQSSWHPARVRWVWLWWRMCRFRLRWPTVIASVVGTRQTVVAKALSSNNYSVPGGLRPILDAPALGWFPKVRGSVVSWTVHPAAGHTLADLAGKVDTISANYSIVDRVDVDYPKATAHKGRLVVSFADELATTREPEWA